LSLLIDSHVVLWWLFKDIKLSGKAHQLIDKANNVYVSAATTWELMAKASLGKLSIPDDFLKAVEHQGFAHLPITHTHALELIRLPWLHKDPFDRILLAQAICEDLRLVTADTRLASYGPPVVLV
jgi:PIN domain nuclease of toxin-antitoxin system